MWDLPRPGLEPVSPALAGRFSTTAPPGKPYPKFLFWILIQSNYQLWLSFHKRRGWLSCLFLTYFHFKVVYIMQEITVQTYGANKIFYQGKSNLTFWFLFWNFQSYWKAEIIPQWISISPSPIFTICLHLATFAWSLTFLSVEPFEGCRCHDTSPLNTLSCSPKKKFSKTTTIRLLHLRKLGWIQCHLIGSSYPNFPSCFQNLLYRFFSHPRFNPVPYIVFGCCISLVFLYLE